MVNTYNYGELVLTSILEQNTASNSFEVDPETVEQYTGLRDKHKIRIYEGDRVCADTLDWACNPIQMTGTIEFFKGSFDIVWDEKAYGRRSLNSLEFDKIKVIGNIHDNPDDVFEKFSKEISEILKKFGECLAYMWNSKFFDKGE